MGLSHAVLEVVAVGAESEGKGPPDASGCAGDECQARVALMAVLRVDWMIYVGPFLLESDGAVVTGIRDASSGCVDGSGVRRAGHCSF